MNIPITRPVIDQEEFAAVQAPLESGWLVQGPHVALFEDRVARYCDISYAVAVSSCTSALHLSLLAAGVGPGDEVLVPAFTYIATANAVEHTGAKPVFLDIDPETFNISVDHLGDYLDGCIDRNDPLPKAVLPVHLFGLCADMPKIEKLCTKHAIDVIEDAACALGSRLERRAAGTFGLAGCFSFHPRKIITTGEGGMVVTGSESMAQRLRILRDHGAEMSDHQRHSQKNGGLPDFNCLGYNYRMTDFQGALGQAQMSKLSRIIEERISIAEAYNRMLKDIPWLAPPRSPDGSVHTYQSYVCRIGDRDSTPHKAARLRQSLMKHLNTADISSRPGTHSVHQLGYYSRKYGYRPEDYPNAWMAHNSAITLPLYPGTTRHEQEFVVETIFCFDP